MHDRTPLAPKLHKDSGHCMGWLRFLATGSVLVVLLALLLPRNDHNLAKGPLATNEPQVAAAAHPPTADGAGLPQRRPSAGPSATAQEIVARKVSQFACDRRAIAHAMAKRLKVEVSSEMERFFDAAEAGQWDELQTRFESVHRQWQSDDSSTDLRALWGPVNETFGVAEEAHNWPAQRLLDYGQAILGSLRPGMVYVGGTDPGRFIPTLLNETSESEHHIVLTQNALADRTYLDYANFLYGDSLATLTVEDSARAFQQYLADAQQRLMHDQQFPAEPKQLRPGEDVRLVDGRPQVAGQIAVMGVNELLLQSLMDKNPDLSFALEESFPLRATYPHAVPLGPIMELRVQDEQDAFTPVRAAQTVDYWRAIAQQLVSDAEIPDGSWARMTYSKMAAAQANLLADHNYNAEAEQAYRLGIELSSNGPEAAYGLANLLLRIGRDDEARQILEDYSRKNPEQPSAADSTLRATTPPPRQ